MTPESIVQGYFNNNYRVVFWPANGDTKGPTEKDWPRKPYRPEDYREGLRVGLLTGVEIAPGKFLHDVDVDWAPGAKIAFEFLPKTSFVFGHGAKRVSHCFYTLPEALPSFKYEDVDKTCLIELRGTKADGTIGLQTMVPPSIWSKGPLREPLSFISAESPAHVEPSSHLKQRVCLAAIAMLLAKRFGVNGFGHEVRLAWAGFLLRAGIPEDDLILMGEAISSYCNNLEVGDVRRTIQSTAGALLHDGKKVKGGPALAKILGKDGKLVIERINEWLGRDSDFVRGQDGRIIAKHQGNVRRAIELLGHELSYDEFADSLMIDGRKMEDREVNSILTRIEIEHRFQPPENYFERVIKFLAWSNPFHPVKDYLDGLTWDKIPRIDTWIIEAGNADDTPYVRAVSSIMLIAAVRRIYHPGCKYDEMVVWESPQGGYKSSAAQSLCPNVNWFSDDLSLNVRSQQLIEATLGKWIIEASDLAGKRKAEIESLKAMLSRQVDGPARMAYAHFPVERPRHFILIGTTNSTAYLPDPTGARRFWPMVIPSPFDVDWIKRNRDQLWAEAVVREAKGESIRLDTRLWPEAAAHQEARREIDPWEPIIRHALQAVDVGGDGRRRVVSNFIWETLAIPLERRDRTASLRITDIMQRLGFKRTRVRPSGEPVQVGFVQVRDDLLELSEDGALTREPGDEDTPF